MIMIIKIQIIPKNRSGYKKCYYFNKKLKKYNFKIVIDIK